MCQIGVIIDTWYERTEWLGFGVVTPKEALVVVSDWEAVASLAVNAHEGRSFLTHYLD